MAIDDVQVSAPDLIARVEPAFAAKALYSLFDNSKTVLFEGQPLKIVNQTRFATSYEWSVDGAEPATSTEAEPEFTFPASGTYTVTLKATKPPAALAPLSTPTTCSSWARTPRATSL